MTIIVKTERVPSDLPPAVLYIDDIEEILRIFRGPGPQLEGPVSGEPEETLSFELGNQICTEISDLEKIGGATANFVIRFAIVRPGDDRIFHLRIDRVSTGWVFAGLGEEDSWRVYRRLKALFDLRKRKWRAFVEDFRSLALLTASAMLGLVSILGIVLRQHIEFKPFVRPGFWIPAAFVFLFVYLTFKNHSVVLLRRRPARATLGDMIRRNEVWLAAILGAVVGAVAGSAATVVAERLIRKWWP